ncbi:MAG: hypothetical protein AVDCRST_MAG18-555, partial [uncultured Thermomicrobiales bacterium]
VRSPVYARCGRHLARPRLDRLPALPPRPARRGDPAGHAPPDPARLLHPARRADLPPRPQPRRRPPPRPRPRAV